MPTCQKRTARPIDFAESALLRNSKGSILFVLNAVWSTSGGWMSRGWLAGQRGGAPWKIRQAAT
ncbi:hypothetical protein IF1G_08425 [Cordyceps javanica]|uniref:Uncharacterized protein n=1 Tax=Cordyceps javanica TaxID=43265 RepID=A0A545UUI9_9HYPO|nr:hypothetical protein IF1G_08425 [Cordyceps javanica]